MTTKSNLNSDSFGKFLIGNTVKSKYKKARRFKLSTQLTDPFIPFTVEDLHRKISKPPPLFSSFLCSFQKILAEY